MPPVPSAAYPEILPKRRLRWPEVAQAAGKGFERRFFGMPVENEPQAPREDIVGRAASFAGRTAGTITNPPNVLLGMGLAKGGRMLLRTAPAKAVGRKIASAFESAVRPSTVTRNLITEGLRKGGVALRDVYENLRHKVQPGWLPEEMADFERRLGAMTPEQATETQVGRLRPARPRSSPSPAAPLPRTNFRPGASAAEPNPTRAQYRSIIDRALRPAKTGEKPNVNQQEWAALERLEDQGKPIGRPEGAVSQPVYPEVKAPPTTIKTIVLARLQARLNAMPYEQREAAMKTDPEIRAMIKALRAGRPKPEEIDYGR